MPDVIICAKGLRDIRGGVKFWVLPLKWLVTLTTVLRYRAACDLCILLSDRVDVDEQDAERACVVVERSVFTTV